jgi:hypothetical protein
MGTPLQQALKQLCVHSLHTFDATQVIVNLLLDFQFLLLSHQSRNHLICYNSQIFHECQVFGSKKNGDMAMVVLRKGLVQGRQTNLQIVQTIVGTVLDKGFGGGDSLFSGASIENGGLSAGAAAAMAKLPCGAGGQEVMEWAAFLGWGWSAALRAGDALQLLQVIAVITLLKSMSFLMLLLFALIALASVV